MLLRTPSTSLCVLLTDAALTPLGPFSRGGLPGEVNEGRLVEERDDEMVGGRGGFRSQLVLLEQLRLIRAVDVVLSGFTACSRSRTLAKRRTSVGFIGEGASTTETEALTASCSTFNDGE